MDDDANVIPSYPTAAAIEEVLAEFDGDYRRAIGALLHDMNVITADYEATVSRGYVRAAPRPVVVVKKKA